VAWRTVIRSARRTADSDEAQLLLDIVVRGFRIS
jgi:hypothetical protein